MENIKITSISSNHLSGSAVSGETPAKESPRSPRLSAVSREADASHDGDMMFCPPSKSGNVTPEIIADQKHVSSSSTDPNVISAPKSSLLAKCCSRIVSVRVIAAAMCLLLIVATAIVVLAVTFSFSLEAAQDIATDQALLLSSKAKGDVEDYLNIPIRFVRSWQFTVREGFNPLPNDNPDTHWQREWQHRLVGAMVASDYQFVYSVAGFDDGNYMDCQTYGPTQFSAQTVLWGDRDINNFSTSSTTTSAVYERATYAYLGGYSYSGSLYDPRTTSWYSMVNHSQDAMQWSSVYLNGNSPIIDINSAMFNGTGTFLGVSGISFSLATLSDFLTQLVSTPNSVTFLIDNEDIILATTLNTSLVTRDLIFRNTTAPTPSHCERTWYNSDYSNLICRLPIATFSYSPLRNLVENDPSFVSVGAANSTSVRELDGQRYYVAVVPIETPLASNMNWRFALFLPEDDIIGGIVAGRNLAIYICLGVVGLAMIISLAVITLLLHPLDAVAERMYRVATMQDVDEEDTKSTKPSVLYEIKTIQIAFNTMTAELAKIKSFLPQSVLSQLYGSSDDEGDEDGGETDGVSDAALSLNRSGAEETVRSRQHSKAISVSGSSMRASTKSANSVHATNVKLNTSVKLSTRKVTMLCLNVVGYHQYVQRRSTDDVVRQHAHIVKMVSDACSEHRGVMDGFQGDRFTISFNAVTPLGNHATHAVGVAKDVAQAVHSRIGHSVSAGVCSGTAMVGNMGSTTTKRFTVLGAVVSAAVLLERLSKRYARLSDQHQATLISGVAVQDVEAVYNVLTVDAVVLPAAGSAVTKRSRVCAVMEPKQVAADEWMYEMQEGHKNSKYAPINNAFDLFLAGDVLAASTAISKFMGGDGTNVVCQATLQHLSNLIDQAKRSAESTDFGQNYTNPLSDYYSTCALPCLPSSASGGDLHQLPSKDSRERLRK